MVSCVFPGSFDPVTRDCDTTESLAQSIRLLGKVFPCVIVCQHTHTEESVRILILYHSEVVILIAVDNLLNDHSRTNLSIIHV